MKRNVLKENLFFSLTWDFLNVYLPSQNQRSDKTVKAYCDALTIFRRYISDECNISIEEFEFKQLTYDYVPKNLLDRPKNGFGVPLQTGIQSLPHDRRR